MRVIRYTFEKPRLFKKKEHLVDESFQQIKKKSFALFEFPRKFPQKKRAFVCA